MAFITYDADELLDGITNQMMDDVKYLGKDPSELLAALRSVEKDEAKLKKDISFIVMLVALRGTKISKMQTRTNPKGLKMINDMFTKYKIVAHTKETPMKNPTLPRIASLMPMLTYKLRLKHRSMFKSIGNDSVPVEFQFPACGAILRDDQMPLWLDWYESFCGVVGIKYVFENASLGHRFSNVPESERILIEEEEI